MILNPEEVAAVRTLGIALAREFPQALPEPEVDELKRHRSNLQMQRRDMAQHIITLTAQLTDVRRLNNDLSEKIEDLQAELKAAHDERDHQQQIAVHACACFEKERKDKGILEGRLISARGDLRRIEELSDERADQIARDETEINDLRESMERGAQALNVAQKEATGLRETLREARRRESVEKTIAANVTAEWRMLNHQNNEMIHFLVQLRRGNWAECPAYRAGEVLQRVNQIGVEAM